MPDINVAKFSIPIKIGKAFDQGKIDKLYQGIYTTADQLSSIDANRFLKKRAAASLSAIVRTDHNTPDILEEVADYKSERLDFHIREMVHLFELYAQSKQQDK
ncbi:MAG: hypothetical protein WC455_07205 [Dehalococcoidia bacterium]|jgi:hypothetical protein